MKTTFRKKGNRINMYKNGKWIGSYDIAKDDYSNVGNLDQFGGRKQLTDELKREIKRRLRK